MSCGDNCGEVSLTSYFLGLRTPAGQVGGGRVILTSGTAATSSLDMMMDESEAA